MTSWLSDASANRHIKTYVKDFLDVSGNMTVRSNEDYKWNNYGQVISGNYETDDVWFGISTHMDASGTTIVVGANRDNATATNNGAAYVYRYDTIAEIWYQLGNTIGSPTVSANTSGFGRFVQISADGDRIAVVDHGQRDIYFYDYNSGTNTWDSAGSIVEGDHGVDPRTASGIHLSGDGNTLVFSDWTYNSNSNTGIAFVFRNTTGTTWTKIGEFNGSRSESRANGIAISYDGSRIIFSEPYYDFNSTGSASTDAGRAAIYDYSGSGTTWTQVGDWIYSDITSEFGYTGDMTADGSIVVLYSSSNGSISVYQYDVNVVGSWKQLGSTLIGGGNYMWGRGAKISDDGITLVAGYEDYDGDETDQGALYVFKYINGDWEQQGKIITGAIVTSNQNSLGFNYSYAMNGDGTKIVSGVYRGDANNSDSGYVHAWEWSQKTYTNPMLDISGGALTVWGGAEENPNNWSVTDITDFNDGGTNYGSDVKFNANGTIMVVGEAFHNYDEGRIFVYKYRNGSWSQMGSVLEYSTGRYEGFAIAINDSGLIIGSGTLTEKAIVWEFINGDWSVKGGEILNGNISHIGHRGVSFNGEGNIVAWMGNDGAAIYQYNSGTDSWDQLGSDFTGLAADNRNCIALNQAGNIVAIGDHNYDSPSTDAGRVGIFQYNSGTTSWDQLGDWITAPSTSGGSGDHYGTTVSLSSDGYIVAFGTQMGEGATVDFHARIFQYVPSVNQWTPRSPDVQNDHVITAAGTGAKVGSNVALSGDGNTLVVGDQDAQTASGVYGGAVHVFKYMNGLYTWVTRLDGKANSSTHLSASAVAISRDGTRLGGCSDAATGVRIGDIVNSPAMTIENGNVGIDGSIGIGTDNPQYKLDLNGDLRIPQSYAANGESSRIWFTNNYKGQGFGNTSINYVGGPVGNENNGSRLRKSTAGATDALSIRKDGNVGIGTHSPNYKLRVDGNCYISSTLNTSNSITSGGLRPGTSVWEHGGGGAGPANRSHHIYFQTSSGGRHPAILATSNYIGFEWGSGGNYGTRAAIGNGGFGTFTGQHRVCIKDVGLSDIPVVKHDIASNELNEDGETTIDAWEKEAVNNDYIGRIVCANQNKFIRISGGVETGLKGITINEALPLTCLSTKANDKSCFGVISGAEDENNRTGGEGHFLSHYDKEKGDARLYVNSLGEGSMWVTNTNGNFESGDYITSSNLIGYGQKQDSEFLSNYTVAKITMDCNFSPITQEQQCILKDASGNNILDSKNQFQWTNKIDSSGNILYEKEYHIRYLDDKAIRITEEEYNAKIAASEEAYIAAFVGCTYHCG